MDSYIKVKDLHFTRGHRSIFSGANLKIPRGKVTAIMGPSGTGKTTLLRLIGGQLKPTKGDIILDGDNVAHFNRKQLFEVRKRMGMLFQSGALFSDISVFENVAFHYIWHDIFTRCEWLHFNLLLKLGIR